MRFRETPFPDEAKEVMKRFGKVLISPILVSRSETSRSPDEGGKNRSCAGKSKIEGDGNAKQ